MQFLIKWFPDLQEAPFTLAPAFTGADVILCIVPHFDKDWLHVCHVEGLPVNVIIILSLN